MTPRKKDAEENDTPPYSRGTYMRSDLLGELLEKPQRETVGSDSSSRFDYQRSWAFCEMLRRHMEKADYLVTFEFHDDTLFPSPSGSPTTAEFYQVKTSKSTNARKLSDFTARRKNSNSILGKMFQNFEGICSAHTVSVILVSNVAFEFADQLICAKDIAPKFRDKIKERLTKEVPNFFEAQLDNLHFLIAGVSIDAMNSFLHGEAMALEKLENELKVDAKRKKEINAFYQARMKEYLTALSVNVLSEADYKNFERQIKTNALGSDLPRSLLAQQFAFLQTMAKFNPAIACPLVLDSPMQQEQDKDNIAAIFKFIFSHVLEGQQLIVGTLSMDGAVGPEGAKTIHLTEELHLLQKEQYAPVLDRIGKMHQTMLSAE